jgi:glycosyltransferase involved in cell wall biosynthesis
MTCPKISIIIPCYNSGDYLPDAIASVELYQNPDDYEVIIINDGSTDQKTLVLLKQLELRHIVIHQDNKGPAAARNAGVNVSNADYLLFLDSDNKIRPNYIKLGIELLKAERDLDILYGNPHFFGDIGKRLFVPQDFEMNVLIAGNYIDMCAVIRKSVWEKLNGFDEDRILIRHEDWDFWIRAGAAGFKFYHIKETLFDYRVRKNSLMGELDNNRFQQILVYLYNKHTSLFIKSFQHFKTENLIYQNDKSQPFRSFVKYLYLKK